MGKWDPWTAEPKLGSERHITDADLQHLGAVTRGVIKNSESNDSKLPHTTALGNEEIGEPQ